MALELTRILTDKKWKHELLEYFVEILLSRRVGQRNALPPRLGAHMDEVVRTFLQKPKRIDGDGDLKPSSLSTGAAAARSRSWMFGLAAYAELNPAAPVPRAPAIRLRRLTFIVAPP
jgi:hypothetical protein